MASTFSTRLSTSATGPSPVTPSLPISARPFGRHSQSELLRRITAGDRTAFWTFWQSVETDIYRVCLGQMGGNVDDAQDALSLVRLKTFEMLPALKDDLRQPVAWLKQVARNLCCDLGRSRNRREMRITPLEALTGEVADPRVDAGNPLDAVMASSQHGAVVTSIHGLPDRLRHATAMRFLGEHSYASIATELSITEATARKRIQEARQILASAWNPSC